MAAYFTGVNFRCSEEEDVPDICQLINSSGGLAHYGLSPDQIEEEISNGQVQWYVLEADSMDELLLAVARFHTTADDQDTRVGVISKLFFTPQDASKEHITQYLMKNMIHQFKRVTFHLTLPVLTVEVAQSDDKLQALLEQEGFAETGGYLAENIGMVFKFSVQVDGEDKGLLHVLSAPSSTATATSHPYQPEVSTEDEEEDLDALLESLDVNGVSEASSKPEEMNNLIDTLFAALHRNDIQPEST